jgi:predicted nucleotidyltransferase
MTDPLDIDLKAVVSEQPDPVLFATVSGAHLYGFPSRDSDVDLRGVHLLPTAELVGLREPEETRSRMWEQDGVEMDLVTHDLRKFVRLMLRRNGYVLEQLLSPLVVHTTDAHRELVALAPGVLTSHHAHHYRARRGAADVNVRPHSGGSSRRPANSSRCSTRSGCCSPVSI